MSTLSGNATKGEKGKKFQQLKILLPSGSKSAEPEQQPNKSSAQRIQHGMTSLGKVPTARRPTNLPSEKSEQSGNDPSVNLVPSGGPGWGNKVNETGPTTTPSLAQNVNPPASAPVNNTPMPGTSQPVQHVQHYPPASRMPPMPSQVGHVPVHHGHPDPKTWARMTLGGETSAANSFTPQSPLFHTEFPSLSSNAEATTASTTHATATVAQKPTTNTVADTQYGPGPSLRPQTVSWMSGSRPQGTMGPQAGNPIASAPAQVRPGYPTHIGPDGARNNLAPSGVGVVPAGPYHPSVMSDKIPQYGALMPPFMLRNSYPGGFPPPGVGPRLPYGPPYMPGQHAPAERFMQPPNSGANSAKRSYDDEDTKIRSIIKEEDLNQMANIGTDIGWAGHEDIDYNQKLKFSDDEDDDKGKDSRGGKSRSKMQHVSKQAADKSAAKKESDKENEFRTSMENLKEREKMFPAAGNRPLEMGNAWHARKNIVAANTTTRYQITAAAGPGPGRFGEDDEELQERRKQKKDEMEIIIQRARERKEEVEKQYQQQLQQAAHIKLKQLDERIEQQRKMENKEQHYTDREMDMLPEWEKEKLRAQNRLTEAQNIEDAKKSATATLVPVVKDASEFRALTQLGDRSSFAKKEKELVNAASNANYSRSFTSNVPPRFQNLNRQSSTNSGTNSVAPPPQGPSDARKNSLSQFSNKSNSPNSFGPARHSRLDSDSMSDKEDTRKERYISDDRPSERYQRDSVHSRDYNYDRDDEQRKYEKDSKKKFYEKGDYAADAGRDFDREANYGGKFERKNSESDRSDKSKDYASRRYSETENHDKEPVMSWRHEESPEKSRHFNAPPRSPRTFSETEHRERKKSREEGNYEKLNFNVADKERDYYRKDLSNRDRHAESEREKEHDHHRDLFDYKSIENDVKRDREPEKKEKDTERKLPNTATYDDRLRESRYSRESREALREESRYTIQEERSYPWVDEGDVEEKPALRRDHHYREERGDRYSHAQRHPPGPITREKLEAKELEDSKRNLTALIRSDKKSDIRKSEPEEKKEKDKQENTSKSSNNSEQQQRSQKREEPIKSAWHKDDKKDKDESKSSAASADAGADKKESKDKDDLKDGSKSASSKQPTDESAQSKGSAGPIDEKRERRDDRKKSERAPKRDTRGSNWARHPVYRDNPYGGRREPKMHRSSRMSSSGGKNSSRRDSKYSESEYSDEISGSGREDRAPRNDRDDRSSKSKRCDRDDRNMDYRNDNRDYMGGSRGAGRNRDYYYKPTHRGRGGLRAAANVGKRMDGYGPPPSKSPFGNPAPYGEERRHKSKDIDGHGHEQGSEKKDSSHADKGHTDGKHLSGATSRQHNDADKAAKKNESAQENKSTVSSPTSVQTAEANEESFATASEGTDSEDTGQMAKSKPTYSGTKRQATVVVAKPQRANYRSTSRKRFEGRRTAPLYSRKDSGSYGTAKRNSTSSGGGGGGGKSSSGGNKENEKYAAEGVADGGFGKNESEGKSGSNEKSRREYSDGQSSSTSAAKKNVKSRNRSNSRKNIRTSGAANSGRSKNQDAPARMPTKQRKSYDTKPSMDYKESKLDIPMPLFKELGPPIPAPPPATNAWDKPITGVLRTGSPSTSVLSAAAAANAAAAQAAAVAAANAAAMSNAPNPIGAVGTGHDKGALQAADQHVDSNRSDLNAGGLGVDKVATKVLDNLDGSTPPVQTIIFENTNFKSAPGDKTKYSNQLKNHRYDKDMNLNANDCAGVSNFGNDSSNSELPSKYNSSITLSYNKNEDVSDMKLDFTFESEFSKLTDDNKSAAKSMELHAMQLGQSTDAELNRKIAQVKKVWDGSLAESYDDVMVNTSATSFSPSFSSHGSDPNSSGCFVNTHVEGEHLQVDDVGMAHNEVVFSPVSQIQGVNTGYGSVSNCQTVIIKNDATSSSSNVCKVKPQPQGSSMASNVAQSVVMSSPSYSFSCSTPQPSLNSNAVAATALAQMNFQAAAAQYGNIPPVPSSPVLYNSTQPAAPGPATLYGAFQIDNQQVAARTQFNQFAASYGLSGQTSAFNQSVFMQQPPPTAPPPDLYSSSLPPYRLQPQAFGNTQQITSPNTVLISSSSNSLMSATIKPSNQQISAIGTKAGYPTAQTSQLTYIPLDPATQLLNQNFMPGSQVLQRPASNLIPAGSLQTASTSFYTTGSGAGQTGYFPTGTNSALQPQPGTAIGLTPYNTQSAAPSLGPTMQNFGSQLTQQFRSAPSYLKGSANACSLNSDFGNGKQITLSNQHDALNTVFPPGTQMSSTKPRIPSGGKNVVQNVQQAMGQHSMSQNSYSYQSANQMRNNGGANKGSQYPHPIQRPVSQGNANSSNRAGNSSGNTSSHRMPVRNNAHQLVNNIQQQPPSSVYYTPSSGYSTSSTKLEASQLDSKSESNSDSKLADSIKTINSKNVTVSSSDKTAVTNE